MREITLNKTELSDLADLPIGKRVRYIREQLQKVFGNDFSGKSVANRIKLFSQSTLTTIERGKSKDIPSQVLYAISKDFGAYLYMFFDDYYQHYTETTVKLAPPLYNASEDQKPNNINVNSANREPTVNPLLETEHVIKTTVSKIATNQDEQLTFIFKSREKYTEQQLLQLFSQIINQINTLDVSVNAKHIENIQQSNPLKLASEFIKHGNVSLNGFPWISNMVKVEIENKLHKTSIQYTKKLLDDLKQNKEKERRMENE